MKTNFFRFGILCALMLCLAVSCSRETVNPGAALTPSEHLSLAQKYQQNSADTPLAIWHYEQFLANASSQPEGAVTLARIQLNACREQYRRLTEDETPDTSIEIRNLQLQIKNLEQRNADLQSWLSRLQTENKALREAHLSRK